MIGKTTMGGTPTGTGKMTGGRWERNILLGYPKMVRTDSHKNRTKIQGVGSHGVEEAGSTSMQEEVLHELGKTRKEAIKEGLFIASSKVDHKGKGLYVGDGCSEAGGKREQDRGLFLQGGKVEQGHVKGLDLGLEASGTNGLVLGDNVEHCFREALLGVQKPQQEINILNEGCQWAKEKAHDLRILE